MQILSIFDSLSLVHLLFIGAFVCFIVAYFLKKDRVYLAPAALVAVLYVLAWIFGLFA